mmetsp:Transcript_41395/g.117107  ORF Transcript_41395/g.117107 Transcript_41395/m.117107 type:complete len:278 (-) Transcript_41395:282-1115(-)
MVRLCCTTCSDGSTPSPGVVPMRKSAIDSRNHLLRTRTRVLTVDPACASQISSRETYSMMMLDPILSVMFFNSHKYDNVCSAFCDAVCSSNVMTIFASALRTTRSKSESWPSNTVRLHSSCCCPLSGRVCGVGNNLSRSKTGLWKTCLLLPGSSSLCDSLRSNSTTNSHASPSATMQNWRTLSSSIDSVMSLWPRLRHLLTSTSRFLFMVLPPKPGKSRDTTEKPRLYSGLANFIHCQPVQLFRSRECKSTAHGPERIAAPMVTRTSGCQIVLETMK